MQSAKAGCVAFSRSRGRRRYQRTHCHHRKPALTSNLSKNVFARTSNWWTACVLAFAQPRSAAKASASSSFLAATVITRNLQNSCRGRKQRQHCEGDLPAPRVAPQPRPAAIRQAWAMSAQMRPAVMKPQRSGCATSLSTVRPILMSIGTDGSVLSSQAISQKGPGHH